MTETPPRIAVVGSGSIGLFYGGRLAADGNSVRFLMRSGYPEAAREGIRIFSASGDLHLTEPRIFREASEIGPMDLVLVAVKATANEALKDLLPPLLHPATRILTLQNGLGNEEFLAELAGADRILGGLCFVCLTRRTPASVDHIGHGTLSLGKFSGPPDPQTHALAGMFRRSGVETHVVENLATERWRKLVWNVPFNGLAAVGNITTNRILSDPGLLAECRALMQEVIMTACVLGHSIETGYADFQIERTVSMGAYRPSTLVDRQEGRELEIEPIWGEPLRRAQAAGLVVPHLEALHKKLEKIQPGTGVSLQGAG